MKLTKQLKKNLSLACAAALLISGMSGCSGSGEASVQIFAMDTLMTLEAYGKNSQEAISAAEQEINRLDGLFSRTNEKSEISAVNSAAGQSPAAVSEDTFEIIQAAIEMSELTGGAFDITVAPIVDAWGFITEDYTVPSRETLDGLLPLVGSGRISLDEESSSVYLDAGTEIDLGGIAKGYASDRIHEILAEYGVSSAIIALGGNVYAIGSKPDGSKWRVAVRDPNDENSFIGIASVSDTSVITSGSYERYFESDGVRYHHIIDPETGCPAEKGLRSVTIITKNGAMGDALSTALFVMGLDEAVEFWRGRDDFEAIFVTSGGAVFATEGIAGSFAFDSSGGYEYSVIER